MKKQKLFPRLLKRLLVSVDFSVVSDFCKIKTQEIKEKRYVQKLFYGTGRKNTDS